MTDFETASAVLEAFRRSQPRIFDGGDVHGIAVFPKATGLEIQVRVHTQDGLSRLTRLLPSTFTYVDREGAARDIPVSIVIAEQSRMGTTKVRKKEQLRLLRAGNPARELTSREAEQRAG